MGTEWTNPDRRGVGDHCGHYGGHTNENWPATGATIAGTGRRATG
ncbi:hypothetical protein [Amycolatopsis sp. cmx-11-12]